MRASFEPHAQVYSGDHDVSVRRPGQEYLPMLHYHDFYEVQFYLSGECSLSVNGAKHNLKRGNIAVLDLFDRHQLIAMESDYLRYSLSLNPNVILAMSGEEIDLREIFLGEPIKYLPEDRFTVFEKLLKEYMSLPDTVAKEMYEKAIIYKILAGLYEELRSETVRPRADKGHDRIVATLLQYVNDNISGDLSLDRLSKATNFSVYHLCRVFKDHTGLTINQYIGNKRIEKAKELLYEGVPLTNIAKETGFKSYSSFYKAFIREEGIGPAEYKTTANVRKGV